MQFSVKVTDYQKNLMLNICDIDLLGKNIIQEELNMTISKSYYGEKIIDHEEAESLLKSASIINMVGKETISLSLKLGVGSENGVKKIGGVPFLIVFKMWFCNNDSILNAVLIMFSKIKKKSILSSEGQLT